MQCYALILAWMYYAMALREEYRIALEACPTPLMLVSRDGEIVLTNRRFDTLFGYADAELQGQTVDVLVPEEIRDFHPELRQAFFEVPTSRNMGTGRDLFGARKSGEMIPVEIGLDPIESDGTAFVMVSVLDIRERKAGETKIRRALDAASSAMVTIDEHGKIELVNEQTTLMFGYEAQELIGQSIEVLVPERHRRKHTVYRVSYQNSRDRRSMGAGRDLFGRRKDGAEFPVEIGLTPIDGADGRLIMATVIDITERKLNEKSIERKNEELQRLNRELSEFAYSASHDLKAPLSSMVGLLELIDGDMKTGDEEEARINLERAKSLARRLAGRIEDMLILAKTDNLDDGWSDLAVRDAVGEVWQVLQGGNTGPETALSVSFRHVDPIRTVPARFHIVLENLLSNAIKYRNPDQPTPMVEIETWEHEELFHLAVRDNGLGIPAKFHGRIFQLFKRVSDTDEPGNGLGLALVKKNALSLGGDVTVESNEQGSTFTVTLPQKQSGAAETDEAVEPEQPARITG